MTAGEISDEYEVKLIKDIDKVNSRLYELLLIELAKFSDGGKLKRDDPRLAQLEGQIREALIQSGYTAAMDKYFTAFEKVNLIQKGYYQKQGLNITPILGDSRLVIDTQKKVFEALRGTGVTDNVIKPIAELIREGVFLDRSYDEAAESLKNKLIEKQEPVKYVKQIATDAISMYDGAIQDEIKVRYNATEFYYVGSIIETSRPFCDHMRDKYGSRRIKIEELQVDLNEFCPGGIPSDKIITYTTVTGEKHTKKKGSGMMENTYVDNFGQKKGGHECRHDVRWIIPQSVKG